MIIFSQSLGILTEEKGIWWRHLIPCVNQCRGIPEDEPLNVKFECEEKNKMPVT